MFLVTLLWRPLCLVQFFVLLAIFIFLGLTPSPENTIPMFNDKLMHCSGYLMAGISISFAFPRSALLTRALFLIAFSIGIEIGQHFMPPRTFDAYDICANSTGVFLGLALITVVSRKINWISQLLYWKTQK
jgi:VanZ family protein